MLHKINFLISYKDKKNIFFLFLGLLVLGFLEFVSIGSIPIIISYLYNNQTNTGYLFIDQLFDNYKKENLIITLSITILVLFLFKNIYLLIFHFYENIILRKLSVNLGSKVFIKYLSYNYLDLKKKNSSEIAKNITHNVEAVRNVISHFLKILKEFVVVVVISILLFYFNFLFSLFMILSFSIIGFIFYINFSKILFKRGKKLQHLTGAVLKNVSQTFGSIKDVIILNKHKVFFKFFLSLNDEKYRHTFFQRYISILPRILFETFMLILFSILFIFFYILDYDISEILPFISLILISGIRLLPSFTIFTTSSTSIKFGLAATNILYDELKIKTKSKKNINKNNANFVLANKKNYSFLKINNLSFKYSHQSKDIITNLNFDIKENNSIIGIYGSSGSGKTTLIEIIMGLIQPSSGDIYHFNENIKNISDYWQSKIGYVPQDIFLLDDTIERNVSLEFDNNLIDEDKFINAVKQSELFNFIDDLPSKKHTIVGERGAEISGGQIQRLAIARALYHDFDLLILDEATNALDKFNKLQIIRCIKKLKNENKVIIIISHEEEILGECDKIYKLEKNQLIQKK